MLGTTVAVVPAYLAHLPTSSARLPAPLPLSVLPLQEVQEVLLDAGIAPNSNCASRAIGYRQVGARWWGEARPGGGGCHAQASAGAASRQPRPAASAPHAAEHRAAPVAALLPAARLPRRCSGGTPTPRA